MSQNYEISTLPILSWIDVARRLSVVSMRNRGDDLSKSIPDGLLETEVFWTGLVVTVEGPECVRITNDWLKKIFGTWITFSGDVPLIRLEGPADRSSLRVKYEFSRRDNIRRIYRPHASLEGHRYYEMEPLDRHSEFPPVIAFHSVKGGVGRTTSAIAFAHNMCVEEKKSVLFIDADFEAPGASYLYKTRKPEVNVSFEDLLALAHADTTDDLSSTTKFVAEQMRDQCIDKLFMLPVKRLLNDLTGYTIRPEHLVNARLNKPYLIVDLIRKLAKELGCQMAVVDLRAGLVDIALNFLTDPSVERIFVSTASGQSVQALSSMLCTLGSIEQQTCSAGRQPLVLINQVPRIQFEKAEFRANLQACLEKQAEEKFLIRAGGEDETEGTPSRGSPLSFGFLCHISELVASAEYWDTYFQDLSITSFSANLRSQMDGWLTSQQIIARDLSIEDNSVMPERVDACGRLAEFAKNLEFAETIDNSQTPLITPPLQRLLEDFAQHPPVIIIEGAKGTGKTLTFRYLVEHETWEGSVRAMGVNSKPIFKGVFLPVLGSAASSEKMLGLINHGRACVAGIFNKEAKKFSATAAEIRGGLAAKWDVQKWVDFWLEAIAGAAGFNDWRSFVDASQRVEGLRPIAIFEGLEEEFTNPYTVVEQSVALRALLKEVPIRLREEAGRPIGILVFARSDMIDAAIEQNVLQFRAAYKNYALTWRDIDIQELVVWLVDRSKAIPGAWSLDWRGLSEKERETTLRKIWGLKLGRDSGNEARSTEWVVAVLTDLTGRLTARDLVRFIGESASLSKEQSADDRLLTASSIRKSVEYTSRKKVDEYPKEVRELDSIFRKIQGINDFATPFDRAEAAVKNINSGELDLLEKYGVAYSEDGSYEVPELFRIGLNIKRKGARPNIIGLTRRARERAKA